MARLYKRIAKVTAYRAQLDAVSWFLPLPNGIEITDLRIQWSIEKTIEREPNTATVTITNCSRSTRSFLERKPLIVRLDAGYDGEARHVFTGDLRFGRSHLDGTDWETELELGDGDRAYRYARINRSYKKGTPTLQVLTDAAATMGLQLPANVTSDSSLQSPIPIGISSRGVSRDELSRLLAPYGYRWSIQDGKLVVLKDGDLRPNEAYVISQDTGMIGTPELGAPDKSGAPPTLKVTTLLYTQIAPGNKIKVQSKNVNGVFRAQRVTHSGDTHGDDWKTEIEARPA